ncbi:MAG: GNAT family N-acetyltransferase [Candidatus Accumulibacter sp.]|uniref:GNAT family N-acetyltransferase n=1 Tax=Accumulibacter sp. TaxID=2053492 RepID=UPI001A47AD5C|nr:GNAT family N-acetyltransferase [Accumulibacter sp.]MBL8393635.1 GNAT family N-acetyltransferase [Accumulibacter sp.]
MSLELGKPASATGSSFRAPTTARTTEPAAASASSLGSHQGDSRSASGRWEIRSAKDSFDRFAADWDRLNSALFASHPFFDSRFVGPLLDHFGDGRERLCLHWSNNRLTGALILRPNGLGRWACFRPSQAQASAVLLTDANLLTPLFAALPGPAWSIELLAVDPRYAPDFSRLSLPRIVRRQARTVGVRLDNTFAAYWKQRPKKLAANVARYFRRAEADLGTLRVVKSIDVADMDAGVARYGALETAGWKGQAGTAVSGDNQQGAFYREVLRRFAANRQAAIYDLYLGEQLASSRLVIVNDHMLVCLKTAYDESLARFAPGRLLLYRLIEDEFARPLRETIEFYTNATNDQKEWSTFGCTIADIQVFRNPLCAAAFTTLRGLRERLRKPPETDAQKIGVRVVNSIDALKTESCDLRAFSAENNLEASANWFELLEKKVYPADPGVRYYYNIDYHSPLVILPLRKTTNRPVISLDSLSNYYSSLYAPLISNHADMLDLQDLLGAAARDHRDAHMIRLAPMDPTSATYDAMLTGLRANDWIPFQFFCFGNWYLKVDGGWNDYLRSRSANLRSVIRRRCKRFAAAGGTVTITSTLEHIEEHIAAFQETYSASWKRPEPYPEFVPSLIRELAALGMLRLGIARIHERTIAVQLWIVDRSKASIYKVAYHEEFRSHSPGTVLTSHLMEHVIEQDHVREVDFLIGDDKYKRMWMSGRRERWGIVAYNPRTLIGCALLVREVCGRVFKATWEKMQYTWLRLGRQFDRGDH